MKPLILNGLLGSHPLGAIASFGLLRFVSSRDPTARLAFELRDDWVARVESNLAQSEEALIGALVAWVNSDEVTRAIDWADDVRVEPDVYRARLQEALAGGERGRVEMMSALVADGAVDAQKGLVKPSAFYMVSGQQSFLGGMREILEQARQSPDRVFREAVFGPWRYHIRAHSLGWDPNAERLYALRSRAPTSEKPSCVAGAVLLAFWALPLMPALSNEGRPLTIGFSRNRREQTFSWPIFSIPIGIDDLVSLLQTGAAAWLSSGRRRDGIDAIFQSSRFEFGQGYAVFRPARAAG
jgi:hypothetical protein